jgi:hypothetical protein
MLRYWAFGLAVDSEIQLQHDLVTSAGAPDVVIRSGMVPTPPRPTSLGEEFVQIRSVGKFYIRGGCEIVAELEVGVRMDLVRLLLSGRLMAYLLRQRGWLPLHASAVKIGEVAVLFLAPSGGGKSTTAARFYADGHEVLSDDVAPVRMVGGKCILNVGEARLRLCADVANVFQSLDPKAAFVFDKHIFRLSKCRLEPELPVARIYLLTEGEELRVEALPSLLAVAALGRECFIKLHRAGPDVITAHLRDCSAVAVLAQIRRLVRPRDLSALRPIVQLVRDDLTGSFGSLRDNVSIAD